MAALLVTACPELATAGYMNGNQLYDICLKPDGEAMCDAYIVGVADGASLIVPKAFCMSSGVDARQMKDVVVAFMKRNAAQRDSPAAELVFWGLASAFACKSK